MNENQPAGTIEFLDHASIQVVHFEVDLLRCLRQSGCLVMSPYGISTRLPCMVKSGCVHKFIACSKFRCVTYDKDLTVDWYWTMYASEKILEKRTRLFYFDSDNKS